MRMTLWMARLIGLPALLLAGAVRAELVDTGATVETEPVPHAGDAADDPCVWIHPTNAALSLIIGTDKSPEGGLVLYNLDGSEHAQYLYPGTVDKTINNVDVCHGFPLGGERVDLVLGTLRCETNVPIWQVVPTTRTLTNIAARTIQLGGGGSDMDTLYGICTYRSPVSDAFYFFVSDKDGDMEQWELLDDGNGKVDAARVRAWSVGSMVEGLVADHERAWLYVGEEDVGIWRYGAEPGDGTNRVLVDSASDGHLAADIEGLALYYAPNGKGYLLASSQGEDVPATNTYYETYAVYEREPPNTYVKSFRIVETNGVDGTSQTDGIDVCNAALGTGFAWGVFIAQDNDNPGANQNFKLVPWEAIARAGTAGLRVDTGWNPRTALGSNAVTVAFAPSARVRHAEPDLSITSLVAATNAGHSECVFMPSTGELLGVDNHDRKTIDVFGADGTYLRTMPTVGFPDMEGLTHLHGDTFAAVDEADQDITFLTITAGTTNVDKSAGISFALDLPGGANDIEGISYDPDNDWFYLAKETPTTVYKVECAGTTAVGTVLFDASDGIGGLCQDFLDVLYDSRTRHLFFLSDLSERVVETDLSGRVLSFHPIDGSLPEGICFSADRSHLYLIVQGGNGALYRYALDWETPGADETDTSAGLEVLLSAASLQTVTVDYAVSGGTAAGGADYALAPGTLVFAPGETHKTIPATLIDDVLAETNETIIVTLGNAGNALLPADPATTCVIRDNDRAFTAYNDLGWAPSQTSANITTWTTTNGYPAGVHQGRLIDYATGDELAVTLTVMGASGVGTNQGAHPAAGTDAYAVFDGKLDALGAISYGDTDSDDLVLTLAGLNPELRYELALYGDRNDAGYVGTASRYHYGTLSGVFSFVNASSSGATILTNSVADDTAFYNAGYNNQADTGYITRFTHIDPGSDGTAVLTLDRDTTLKYYTYANALMVKGSFAAQTPPPPLAPPAAWASYYLGVPDPPPNEDPDADGLTTIEEYICGTHPSNAPSTFAVDGSLTNGQAVVVSFAALEATGTGYAGLSRRYTLEQRNAMETGAWSVVAGYAGIPGTNQTVTYLSSNAVPAFFRAKVWLE
ncbi:MAG: phytase [Kiritimatiellae bacterium]|nr:phytase [Kiritimatiellia bacterium]